jgi:nucleotide-binding universal stress UspA family protein
MPVTDEKIDMNLKSVVFATDFSLCSQNAGLYAASMASYFSAAFLVAHAFTLSQAAMVVETNHGSVSQQRKDLELLLANTAAGLGGGSSEPTPCLLEGSPKVVIPQLADRHQPSMIVLGTHGGGWLGRGVIGSVAEQILRSTRWPSLTVGPSVGLMSSKPVPFERLLIATNFSPSGSRAIIDAMSLAVRFGAAIDVLHVVSEDAIEKPERVSDLQKSLDLTLDALVPQEARKMCEPKLFVEVGNAHERICAHIRERSIDLLVLGIRKTSHLALEMRTSRAFRMIVDAQCPVLTISS